MYKLGLAKCSRYRGIDDNFYVFATPLEIREILKEGFNYKPFKHCMDVLQPFCIEVLVEIARETMLGTRENGGYLEWRVKGATNVILAMCVEINGKLFKIQSEEYESDNEYLTNSTLTQTKLFQRLIKEKRITVEDLEVADIDIGVYKQILLNNLDPENTNKEFDRFMGELALLIERSYYATKTHDEYEAYEDSEKLDNWLKLADDYKKELIPRLEKELAEYEEKYVEPEFRQVSKSKKPPTEKESVKRAKANKKRSKKSRGK